MSRDQQAILDIIDSIELIQNYARSNNWSQARTIEHDAVIRRLTIIGEATKRLSMEFRTNHPEIPWKAMAGLRDFVVHEYDVINLEIIQDVVNFELPKLLPLLKSLLDGEF
ncbi:HepT-like ribonuclease domain-containing protein [Limnothrix redekei]|uniref:HepT-like ribonuclease domain-containing protein n=1 Tax=Limnothrix redekei LRLZ20PSL1 TaxID=3112953 RepID=A0ABW7C6X4_9CYAN